MRIFSTLVFVALSLLPAISQAHQSLSSASCEQALGAHRAFTPELLRDLSIKYVENNLKFSPVPEFDNIEEQAKINPVGVTGPLALQQAFGMDKFFVASPAPTAKDPITVSLIEPAKHGFPVHVDVQWAGKRTSTTVYTSVPWHLGSASAPGILKRADLPLAVMHLHGGGTPTAGGVNFDKVAENLLKFNVPTIAPDMPGHGRGPSHFEGFEGAKQQLDWILQVADEMLHPNTKIVLSGHSWGAMFGVYLQRLKRLDPKYQRIIHILAIAPGIDPTLGGSAEDRNKFEQWYQDNFRNFKHRIAESDFEFQENVLANGKDSDKGAMFTGLFNLDYALPPLTAEEYAELTPMTVIVGTADGVVYVGFEEQFEELFGALGERYIKLGDGPTFHNTDKTKLRKTGHQVFDRELMPGEDGYVEGKDTYQVYRMIGNLVRGEAKGASFPETASTIASPSSVIDSMTRNYANFFGFRVYLGNAVEFVDGDTEWTIPMAAEKRELDGYLGRLSDRRDKGLKEVEAQVAAAVQEMRQRIGAHEKLTLEYALAELATPALSPEREKAIREYLAQVEAIDQELLANFADEESERALTQLKTENQAILEKAGITDMTELKAVVDRLNAEDKSRKSEKAKAKADAKARGEKWEEDLAQVRIEKEQDRFRSSLAKIDQAYKQLNNQKQAKFGQERNRRVAALKAPEGIADTKQAARELKVDRSPERRQLVEKFVAEYNQLVPVVRAEALAELDAILAEMPKPAGVVDERDAEAKQIEINARKNLTYVSPKAPATAGLVARIESLHAKLDELTKGQVVDGKPEETVLSLNQLDEAVMAAERKVSELAKTLDLQWAKRVAAGGEAKALQDEFDQKLDIYKVHYSNYENAKSAFLADLDRRGLRTAENIVRQTPELLALRAKSQEAKKAFLQAKAKRDAAKLTEGFKKAQTELQLAEAALEARRRQIGLTQQDLASARKQYIEAMQAAGERVPLVVREYNMYELFNRDLDTVRSHLESDRFFMQASINFLSRWDGFMAEIRRKHNLLPKEDSGY